MTNRRLNKKVALVGSVIFIGFVLGAILVILKLSGDPQELIKDAEVALQAARQATDEKVRQQNYDRAESSLRGAYSKAKTNSLRKEVLFKMVDMYLDVEDTEWPFILGSWNEIIRVDPNNAEARFGLLKYFYIMADNGFSGLWQEVHKQASEFIEVVKDSDILMEDTLKWDVFETKHKEDKERLRLGPYLYLLKGRSALEMASLGAVTDRIETITQAVDDLNKVKEYEPGNVDACWYLARAAITKGQILASRGAPEEREKAIEQAMAIMKQAVQTSPNKPQAHIKLLSLKLEFNVIQNSDPAKHKEQFEALEPEYLSLVRNFDSSAEAFAALSQFYAIYSAYTGPRLGSEKLDKSIEAIEQAIKLDEQNVFYSIRAANLYYRKYSLHRQQPQIYKAVEMAKKALTLPDAQVITGPRHHANKTNRFILYAFLTNCYIEQILEPVQTQSPSQTAVLMAGAEQAVHEIEQIFGSDEEPLIIKWRGMLELAKGNKEDAVKDLYAAYEKYKALQPPEPPWPPNIEFSQLSYNLAKIFKETPEIGMVGEFLVSAIYSGISEIKPEARLDYVDVLFMFGSWSDAIRNINAFEDYYGSTDRSRRLRIRSYIGAKQFNEAEGELASLTQDDPNTIRLRVDLVQTRIRQAQLNIAQKKMRDNSNYVPLQSESNEKETVKLTANVETMAEELESLWQYELELLEKLLRIEPNYVRQNSVIDICRNYIANRQPNRVENLVNKFLEHFPDDTRVQVYRQILSEPDPVNITEQRFQEIEEQVLSNISDPVRRETQLGIFYLRRSEIEKATSNLRDAVETGTSQLRETEGPTFEYIQIAASHLLDIALGAKSWELAEQIVQKTAKHNLDGCHGKIFEARLAMAKGNYENALAAINESLKRKPVFSYAYLLRSEVNAELGNEHASMEDILKAASLNPLDGVIAKASANILYRRNTKPGASVSSDQMIELRTALERAISLNPGDLSLLSLYAEYITPTEPMRAIAIRQDLQRAAPSMENALMLGQLATQVAVKETDAKLKEAIFGIAASVFTQAKEMNPNDRRMLYYYAEYFRAMGDDEKATSLLKESQDKQLLWDNYFQQGRYDDARLVLMKLYEDDPKNEAVLRGLLLVAERLGDKEAIKKYSGELIAFKDTAENNLVQIEVFLRAGLIKEAEYKLQSFKEKYPNERKVGLFEGWLLMRKGQLKKALELTNRNLQTSQNNPVAWRLRGEINFLLGDYDKAISDLRESKLISDNPVTRVSLAKAYMGAERYEDAITELQVTINTPGIHFEAGLLLEQIYSRLDRKEALRKFYKETLEKFPDNIQWLNRAGAFAVKMGDFAGAESLYKKSYSLSRAKNGNMEKDALYAAAFDGYMNTLILGAGKKGTGSWNPSKLDTVFHECGQYLDGNFASAAYLLMAQAKLKLDDKTTALEYCRNAVEKAGENEALVSVALLRMLKILGPDEVLRYCAQKLESNPNSIAANFAMFNLTSFNNEYDKALDYIERCINLTGPDDPNRLGYIMKKADVLTLAYDKSSDKKYLLAVIALYKSLLNKMPNNTIILNDLAYFLAENNEKLSEALQYAKRALDEQPNNPGCLDTYAYILHKNGENSQALEFVMSALQQYQHQNILVPAVVYEHKGLIKEALGARDEALAAYRQALREGQDELSQTARQRINKAVERLSH
ncbi:MAG: tetratricopeptide repeat protein [Sedimentisphaerales bacterium]|nr:tetratricopeptide repeat protein [Sedimentisphaerales bacterium]